MYQVLSVPTIMLCISITMLGVAVVLTYAWITDNRESAIPWWCGAMWIGMLATALQATRSISPWWFGIGIGNIFAGLTFAMVWAGFRAFTGKRPSWMLVFMGAAIWAGLYYGNEAFRNDINARLIFLSLQYGLYSAMIVHDTWRGWKDERLPSLAASSVLFTLHGVHYIARIAGTVFWPASEVNGVIIADWLPLEAMEGFALTIFSTLVFIALVKERAERRYRLAAEIDSLTEVASRRFFVSETRTLLARRPEDGVLAVIDLDYFKRINDTYGHMAGDRVLQAFARRAQRWLPDGALFGRLGGEEFGIYLPDCSEEDASVRLEVLRADVEALEIAFLGNTIKLTTSIGLASVAEAGIDFDHLMAGADNALYMAKHEGRNRLKAFHPTLRIQKIVEAGKASRVSLSQKRVSRLSVRSHSNRR